MQSLQAILHDTFKSTWLPNITQAAAQAFLKENRPAIFVLERGQCVWVAEYAQEIVGLVDWEGDVVRALHVFGRYARKGGGAALMDQAEAKILEAGCPTARLETDTFNIPSQTL